MNIRAILKYIGHILLFEGVLMFPALIIAAVRRENGAFDGFLLAMLLLVMLGLALTGSQHKIKGSMYAREGFVTVALAWILISLFGALPYYIGGAIERFVDCWFEAVSGFTTTGATILPSIESLPRSILYWRSFSGWLGGMGVLVFMLAVLPGTKGSGETLHLIRAEVPGPSVGKLTPRLRHTARLLYVLYVVFTAATMLLLLFAGLPLFESLTTAFSIAGTGGFAITNAGIAGIGKTPLHVLIAVLMVLAGVNFSLYYMAIMKQARAALRNEELRVYLLVLLAATVMITLDILPLYAGDLREASAQSFFQVSSLLSTTGYHTTDYNQWPQFSRFLLLLLMVVGACAGSTGGGIKISRVMILLRSLAAQLRTMLRPRAVKPVRLDGKTLGEDIFRNTAAYIAAYIGVCLVSVLIVSIDGHSMESAVSAVLASLSNIGPGFDMVGPTGNFSLFSPLSKVVLSFNMLIGRLEIFPILLLFAPGTWKKWA